MLRSRVNEMFEGTNMKNNHLLSVLLSFVANVFWLCECRVPLSLIVWWPKFFFHLPYPRNEHLMKMLSNSFTICAYFRWCLAWLGSDEEPVDVCMMHVVDERSLLMYPACYMCRPQLMVLCHFSRKLIALSFPANIFKHWYSIVSLLSVHGYLCAFCKT